MPEEKRSVWDLVSRHCQEEQRADVERLERRRATFEQRLATAVNEGAAAETITILRSQLADISEQLRRAMMRAPRRPE
jgi:hypothetical protein